MRGFVIRMESFCEEKVGVIRSLLLLLMTFIGRKLRHAANVPSQPLHDYSYPRTGTFSVVS